jgi:hypothetical protein
MRNTYLDLDHESTIVSMLALRGRPIARAPSSHALAIKVLLVCIGAGLLLVYFMGSA